MSAARDRTNRSGGGSAPELPGGVAQDRPQAEPAKTRPAATVILLRRGRRHDSDGVEVLLLQRGAGARFMPGVWVFAGGVVETGDREHAERTPLDGVEADEWAHRIAGARELGEEADVALEPQVLVPWSRWITPVEVPVRFDTRFYVAPAPPHCRPRPDGIEMDEARWISPRAALEQGREGSLELSFPTVRNLEALAPHRTLEAVLEAAKTAEFEPILPRVIGSRDSFEVLLPGEPGYES